jgi:hypothetical protein
MSISGRTRAVLIEVAADAYTHDQLDVLFLRLGVDHDPQVGQQTGRTKLNRLSRAVGLLEAEGRTVDLARELVEERFASPSSGFLTGPSRPPDRLVGALRIDGYEVVEERLVATTPGPAALGSETSLLEETLQARGHNVAASHYRQAVDSYVDGRREASNGQLRSFLEALLLDLCERVTGQRPGSPRGAIDRLRSAGAIDGEEADLLKGIVGVSNDRGAHAGLTDADEALFRLHFATSAARYLLARVQ